MPLTAFDVPGREYDFDNELCAECSKALINKEA